LTCLGNLSSLNRPITLVGARVAVRARFGIKAARGVPTVSGEAVRTASNRLPVDATGRPGGRRAASISGPA
jgi:hypothetical protein